MKKPMPVAIKSFIQKQYSTSKWYGRVGRGRRVVKGLRFESPEIAGWTLHRERRDENEEPPAIHSLWRRGGSMSELLAIDLFECSSLTAAHDQLIEALANIESDAVQRRTSDNSVGDVAFGLSNTMDLF